MTGAITGYIDVAQLALYAFWLFFLLLVLYLHREGKREGYPLLTDANRNVRVVGFPDLPDTKEYLMPHGEDSVMAPRQDPAEYEVAATPLDNTFGSALHPSGDPMRDGVGPAAWAIRPQFPDRTIDGEPKIVPMRIATDFGVSEHDPDPRGKAVYGLDGEKAGEVVDLWVDRAEPQVRYLELACTGFGTGHSETSGSETSGSEGAAEASPRRVLLPITLARVSAKDGTVRVRSIKAKHFANVPTLASHDQTTLQEEDQICAYYGGGNMYATAERTEPLI
ncbi:MAG: photosynthetic reaction center subunit H [Chromatocurvus sp.]